MSDTDLLKNSIKRLYYDSPEILYMLDQIDYSTLNVVWKQEIEARIDRSEYDLVEEFLASALYARYTNAVSESTMAMTRPLTELITFVLQPKGETH